MTNQFIPPIALATPSVRHLPLATRVDLWGDVLNSCEAMLLASLRQRIGSDGDLAEAYRVWYSRYLNDHENSQIQFLENLSRREAANREAASGN